MSNPERIIVGTLLLEGGNNMGVEGEIVAEGEFLRSFSPGFSLTVICGKLG